MYNVGFIPARAGSKGIKSKNITDLAGKPLVWYSLFAAENSCLDKVYLSTDSDLIKDVVEGFGFNKVEVVSRSSETADDKATSESALIEFANKYEFDNVVFLQATSPFTASSDIDGALDKFLAGKYGALISVVKNHQFIWNVEGEPLNYNPQNRPRRQDWDGYYIENGAFYISSRENILKSSCRITPPVGVWEMPKKTLIEIDTEDDMRLAERVINIIH